MDGADDGLAHEVVAGNRFQADGGRKLGHKMCGLFMIRRAGPGNFSKFGCRMKH